MNLFTKSKNNSYKEGIHLCHFCNAEFKPDKRNLKRGWGMFCSKTCSSLFRLKLKTSSESERKKLKRDLNLRKLGIL
jgi:hypothetical protein